MAAEVSATLPPLIKMPYCSNQIPWGTSREPSANALIAARENLAGDGVDLRVVKPRQRGWNMVVAMLEAASLAIPSVFESLANAVAGFEQVGAVKGGSDA